MPIFVVSLYKGAKKGTLGYLVTDVIGICILAIPVLLILIGKYA